MTPPLLPLGRVEHPLHGTQAQLAFAKHEGRPKTFVAMARFLFNSHMLKSPGGAALD